MPRAITCLSALALLLLVTLPHELQAAPAEDTGRFESAGLEDGEVRTFLAALQKGVLSGHAEQVAGLIEFPLDVHECKGTLKVHQKDFKQRFSSVFDPKISAAIKAQTFETLFTNSQGVMIGDGEVWFSGICEGSTEADPCPRHRLRVITVNKVCP